MQRQYSLKSAAGRWVLMVTTLASGSIFLLSSAVTIALPAIQAHFDSDVTALQWVVEAYLLALVSLLLLGGSLGDRLGLKKTFLLGAAVFTAGAVLSGLAGTMPLLIAFQALQGIGAALLIPQSLALINAAFAEKERGRAIGLWAGISGGIAAIGSWLGGWLVESFGWPAVFFLIVPFGLLTVVTGYLFLPEIRRADAHRTDWLGAVIVFASLMGLAYGLINGPVFGWGAPPTIASLVVGLAGLTVFVFLDRRRPEALLPFSMFRNRNVVGANLATLCIYFTLNGVFFVLVLYLQQVLGYSPLEAGLALLPPIVVITLFSGPAGALADRIGPHWPMVLAPVFVSSGVALLAISGSDARYYRDFLPGLMLIGIGMALVIAPLTKSALAVLPEFSGAASGLNNAVARLAALLAVAVLGAVLITSFSSRLQERIGSSSLGPGERAAILSQTHKLGAIEIPGGFDAEAGREARQAIRESFVYGFRWAMGAGAAIALGGSVASLLMIRNPTLEKPDAET